MCYGDCKLNDLENSVHDKNYKKSHFWLLLLSTSDNRLNFFYSLIKNKDKGVKGETQSHMIRGSNLRTLVVDSLASH